MFLHDETGPAGASSGYKGLRAPARSPEMRLGRKCALIGDWAHAETESAGIPAQSRRAWICRVKQPGRMVSSVYSSRHRSPVREHSLTGREHRQLSVCRNRRTGRATRLKENNDFGWVAMFLNRELASKCAAIAYWLRAETAGSGAADPASQGTLDLGFAGEDRLTGNGPDPAPVRG